MQRATILRSNLARQGVKTTTQVQKMQRNVAVRARVETLFLEEGFVAPDFTLPWPEKGFQSISLMKDVVKVGLTAILIFGYDKTNVWSLWLRWWLRHTTLRRDTSLARSPARPLTHLTRSSRQADTKAVVFLILSNHCPFVVHLKDEIIRMSNDYKSQGVEFVAISPNDPKIKEKDSAELMAKEGYPFPYLFDEAQEVAKMYKGMCTPDIYAFRVDGGELKLAYQGQLDSSRPERKGGDPNIPNNGEDLRAALDCIVAGQSVPKPWKPSIGCSIKWSEGNEPVRIEDRRRARRVTSRSHALTLSLAPRTMLRSFVRSTGESNKQRIKFEFC